MTLGVTTMAFSVYFSTSFEREGARYNYSRGRGTKHRTTNPEVDTLTLKAGKERERAWLGTRMLLT